MLKCQSMSFTKSSFKFCKSEVTVNTVIVDQLFSQFQCVPSVSAVLLVSLKE